MINKGLRLSIEMFNELQEEAKKKGLTLSAYIRLILSKRKK